MESASLFELICLPIRLLFGGGGLEPLDMLYLLGRCLDPRNLRRSGDITADCCCCCFDFDDNVVVGSEEDFNVDFLEEEEFFRLLPPTEEPRRDEGDATSLSSRRCREVLRLRLLNLLINDGIIDSSPGRREVCEHFV